jgi:hypothetical protein
MTNQELIDMWEIMGAVRHLPCTAKFGYKLAVNRKLIEPHVDSLNELGNAAPEYIQYEEARVELARVYADRTEDDQPKTIQNVEGVHYLIQDREDEWNEALAALREEHADAIEARKAQKDEVADLLKSDAEDFQFTVIQLDEFPDGITSAHIECLMPLVAGE